MHDQNLASCEPVMRVKYGSVSNDSNANPGHTIQIEDRFEWC